MTKMKKRADDDNVDIVQVVEEKRIYSRNICTQDKMCNKLYKLQLDNFKE